MNKKVVFLLLKMYSLNLISLNSIVLPSDKKMHKQKYIPNIYDII